MGVFAPVVGLIGTAQAAETLKLLMELGETLSGRLLMVDALTMQWRSIKLAKDPGCKVCGRGQTAQQHPEASACSTAR
jgi:molybdopterin/thiamine biosynthesis adenylyltransferase